MPIGFNKQAPTEKTDDLSGVEDAGSKRLDPKYLLIGGVVVAVAVIGMFALKTNSSKSKDKEVVITTEFNSDEDLGVGESTESGVKIGITNYDHDFTSMGTSDKVFSTDDFIKDLNGVDVPAIYNVSHIEFIEDYVNYETRRGIMSDGMELYWLEAVYKKKKYRIQIPYYYYKDLGTDGICKVNIEVLSLSSGGTIISFMEVVPDDSAPKETEEDEW